MYNEPYSKGSDCQSTADSDNKRRRNNLPGYVKESFPLSYTGIGPYTFTYALDGVPQPPVATAANLIPLNVTAAGTYTIINVSDANCTNNGSGTTTVTYFPKPVGIISGTAEMCRGISSVLTMTFTGAALIISPYSDGTTPVTVVGHFTNVYTVAVSPLISSTYTLTSFTDGNGCAVMFQDQRL